MYHIWLFKRKYAKIFNQFTNNDSIFIFIMYYWIRKKFTEQADDMELDTDHQNLIRIKSAGQLIVLIALPTLHMVIVIPLISMIHQLQDTFGHLDM